MGLEPLSSYFHAELKIASQIQRNFLPEILPEFSPFELAATLLSAETIGGDFYYAWQQDGYLAIMIGDVSGKGIPASLFTPVIITLLKSELRHSKEPATLLRNFNALLYEALDRSDSFITLFLGLVPADAPRLLYASAGHTSALFFQRASKRVFPLQSTGFPLGVTEDLEVESNVIEMHPGDEVLLYTDGFSEAENRRGRVMGAEALADILMSTQGASGSEQIEIIRRTSYLHRDEQELHDDAAALLLRYPEADPALLKALPFVYRAEKPLCLRQLSALLREQALLLRYPSPASREATVNALELALNEVLNNIIDHAYRAYNGRIYGVFRLYSDRIQIQILDSGQPFARDTASSAASTDIPTRGYGLLLAKRSLDVFAYERFANRNIWILEKKMEALP